MRTLSLLILFQFLLTKAEAQIPFPTDQAVWVNSLYQEPMTFPPFPYVLVNVTNYCVNGQDTLINAVNYTKVNECGGAYHGALREVGQEVWYVPKDSTNEYLIYDFAVTPGEVLQNVYLEQAGTFPMVQDLTVVDVTTVQINGVDHVAVDFGSGPMFYWIEGIGNASGFLCEPWGNVSQYMVKLECMSLAGITYYPTYSVGVCPMDLGFEDLDKNFSILPNPFTDVLTVSFVGDALNLKLYDASGREINIDPIATSEGMEIDVHLLDPGIYILGTSLRNGQKVIKL